MASFGAFLVVFYAIWSYKRPVIDTANQRVPDLRPWRLGPILSPECGTLPTFNMCSEKAFFRELHEKKFQTSVKREMHKESSEHHCTKEIRENCYIGVDMVVVNGDL